MRYDLSFAGRWRAAATLVVLLALFACSAGYEDVEVEYKEKSIVTTDKGKLLRRGFEKWELGVYRDGKKTRLSIAVADIRKVNGLPLAEFVTKWKTDHAAELCPVCQGDCFVTCDKCKGKGYIDGPKIPCPDCNATGTAPCKAPGCKDGQVPCPGDCIKLGKGRWVKGKPVGLTPSGRVNKTEDDGHMWIIFSSPNVNAHAWSEGHVGEVVKLVDGEYRNLGKCPICQGKGTIACKVCEGKGSVTCPTCKGEKEIFPPCEVCHCSCKIDCTACAGRGLKLDDAATSAGATAGAQTGTQAPAQTETGAGQNK